jgi:CubicO group peptidase (beta-lactamase class C family)
MANLELAIPITPASVFHVASISKQFTAMSILLLVERGKLSIDDEARKYITELPDYGTPLTIRHLLTHTSGLRDAFLLQGLAAPREGDADATEALMKILARQRSLNFKPGAEFQYNNGGYAMLAAIVKRVTGQSLREFAESNIFKPLGMTNTHFHDDPTLLVRNRASGYHRDTNGWHVATHPYLNRIVGNTGLFTTARDLMLWEKNFSDVQVGTPELVAKMQTPVIPTGWPDGSSYGFGLEIGDYRGLRMIGHGGGDPGYGAYVAHFPDQQFAVAVLGNFDDFDPAILIQRVADIYLADTFRTLSTNAATSTPAIVSLSAEQLASKAGLYRDPSSEIVGRFFVRKGKLVASQDDTEGEGLELAPLDTNHFVIPGTKVEIEFVPAANGRPQQTRVTGAGPKPIVSEKLAPFVPSHSELREFEGRYTSPELDTTYTLSVHDSGLVVQMSGRPDALLRPLFPDAFAGVTIMNFTRDARRAITGFTLRSSGVRALHFDRLNQ